MNSKRRAELQRKLSMNAVPRPPAGLKDRIVADIPKYLEVEPERGRFSRAIALNMRVAASILLMVTGVLTALYLLSPQAERPLAVHSVAQKNAARELGISTRTDTMHTAAAAPTEEVHLEIDEETDVARIAAAAQPIVQQQRRALNEERAGASGTEPQAMVGGVAGGVVGGVAGGVVGGEMTGARQATPAEPVDLAEAEFAPEPPAMRDRREAITITAEAPMVAAPASAPAPAPAPVPVAAPVPPPPSPASAALTVAPQRSASIVTEAYAAKIALERKTSVFGISVDPAVFHRIKTTLESGNRPPAATVNVDALVNYFAGQPAARPSRGVRLEVEASPAAIEADGDHATLRFTIDTQNVRVPAGGSTPPVAADATVKVEFNEKVVAQAHPVGDAGLLVQESALLAGTSVTGLYAVELKPDLRSKQLVATVTLQYTSIPDGRKRTITRQIHGKDLAKSWAKASPRHRRATLGAVWGETLKGTGGGTAVARRAEELATQNPNDTRARELAQAASASAGGR